MQRTYSIVAVMAMMLCFGTADAWKRHGQLIQIDDIQPRMEPVQREVKSSKKASSYSSSRHRTSQASDTQIDPIPAAETNEQVEEINDSQIDPMPVEETNEQVTEFNDTQQDLMPVEDLVPQEDLVPEEYLVPVADLMPLWPEEDLVPVEDLMPIEEMNGRVEDIILELDEILEETESALSDGFGSMSMVSDTLPI